MSDIVAFLAGAVLASVVWFFVIVWVISLTSDPMDDEDYRE